MEILFFKEDIDFHWSQEKVIRNLIHDIILHESIVKSGTITIIFCSDAYLLDINIRYLDHNYYTDIITFPYTSDPLTADLFISIDRVKDNAELLNQAFHSELLRVIIHGILHLCGYGDKTPSEVKIMRTKEDHYLNELQQVTDHKI